MARKPKREQRWEEALRRLTSAEKVCLDVETSGLDWKRNHIVGWVLTFGPKPEDSYYLAFRHAGGGNIEGGPKPPQDAEGWDGKLHPVEHELIQRLERVPLLFGHNMDFDLKFAMRAGLRVRNSPRIEDTAINAPLLDEWQGQYNLDFCARKAGVQAKKGEALYEHIARKFGCKPDRNSAMPHFWRMPGDDPLVVEYAEGDGTTTWQLRDWQMRQIADQELGTVHDIESRLIPVLARMSFRGIKVDEERLQELRTFVDTQIEVKLSMFPAGFNTRSPQDVEKWCTDHGHTDWPLTKLGKPSFTEAWLSTHEAGRKIVEVRKLQTLKTSFLDPMAKEHLWKGRVHPQYHQLRGDEYGTVTGRLSCSHPNLQAVSKRDKQIGKLHRSIFVPDDGHIWASADYMQCEPVLLAHYSGCKVLVEGYRANPPIDAHSAVAQATGLSRETGKRVNQTLITGGGKGVLVSKYGIPESEVHRIWTEYFRKMPEIRDLQKRAKAVFRQRGYILSPLGRRARLRDLSKDYTAMNRLLQCGNADIIKLKMVEIDEYCIQHGDPVQLLNNIHDDLAFQFRPENRKHFEECLRIMQDFSEDSLITLSVPLRCDVGEGRSWAEATYGPEA